jgi:hypothetical protein
VALFRRKPLHERLAEEGGLVEAQRAEEPTQSGHPRELDEQFFGERSLTFFERLSGEVTAPRPRRWDVVEMVEAEVDGDTVAFVALPDGSLIVDEEEGDADLDPLARAVEAELAPPYRATARRESDRVWSVWAKPTQIAELEADGDEITLAMKDGERTLTIDGRPADARLPELERLGEQEGADYVVHATRLDGDLWEIQTGAL